MKQLAILGGEPVKKDEFKKWPQVDFKKAESALQRVLYSEKWGSLHGEETKIFGKEFAEYQQARFGIPCANGSTAIKVALSALGIGYQDEVIIPAYTFIATAIAVFEVGAIPVVVDVEPETYNISIEEVKKNITPNTKAIIPVHIGGRPVNMDAIMEIAKKHSLLVVEDAAQGWGSVYKGKKVGALGDMGTFSFQSSKNITSGEGGIVLTNNQQYADLCESWVNCGRKKDGIWYAHYYPAGNNRITEFQSAILREQLKDYETQKKLRQKNAQYLDKRLSQIPGIEIIPFTNEYQSSVHIYMFQYNKSYFHNISKQKFIEALKAEGIPCSGGYSLPLNQQPVFEEIGKQHPYKGWANYRYKDLNLVNSERACQDEAIWFFQWMMLASDEDIRLVADAIEKVTQYSKELI